MCLIILSLCMILHFLYACFSVLYTQSGAKSVTLQSLIVDLMPVFILLMMSHDVICSSEFVFV